MVEAIERRSEEKRADKMIVIVTGSAGFLGTKVMKILKDDFELIGTDKNGRKGSLRMDITDRDEVNSVMRKERPDVVLHIAAITDVDRCEVEKELAKKINVDGTKNIIKSCKDINAKIVYFSTDFVFDGKGGNYKEEDKPNPLSHYAETKLEAENLVRKSGLKYLIIRPEVLYGYNGDDSERSFSNWVYVSLKGKKEIRVVDDHFNTPTLVDDLAEAIKILIKKNKEGIYHVAGPERLSRYGMALKIADAFGFDKSLIRPIKTAELKQKAKRPRDSSLNTEKLKREGIMMHSFGDGLKIMKKQIEACQ